MEFYSPNDSIGPSWTIVGAPTLHEAVDDPRVTVPNDSDYVFTAGTTAEVVAFGFPFPAFYAHSATNTTIKLVNVFARFALSGAGTIQFEIVVSLASGAAFISAVQTITNVSPIYVDLVVPIQMGIRAQDLASSVILVTMQNHTSTNSPVNLQLSRFYISVSPVDYVGGTRARLGPRMNEEAYFCAVCSRPYHRSELTKIQDPRHHYYNLWVCRDDVDQIDPEPIGPRVVEGDRDDEP